MKKAITLLCAMLIIVVSMLTSCVPQKKLLYLQNEKMLSDSAFMSIEYPNARTFDYKVQPGDNLYIRISSLDMKAASYFNAPQNAASLSSTSSQFSSGNPSIYLNGYNVSSDGTISLPYAGSISVKDMTIEEIQNMIQEIINEYLRETVVYVKLGLFNLTILGEVMRPGQYQVYQPDINIFQALAMAGNATDFANKAAVKIVHQTPNGSQVVKVNLNDTDILSSPDYYLKPNDIIYVEPLKMKQYGFTNVPYGTIISAISLLVTCFTFVAVYLK